MKIVLGVMISFSQNTILIANEVILTKKSLKWFLIKTRHLTLEIHVIVHKRIQQKLQNEGFCSYGSHSNFFIRTIQNDFIFQNVQ